MTSFRKAAGLLRLVCTVIFSLMLVPAVAQLPQCDRVYMDHYDGWTGSPTGKIYVYNPALPVSGSNPSLSSITLPSNADGLTVSEVLGSGSNTLTFYTVKNSVYYYYNPTTSVWVNTGHNTGNTAAVNIAAGGGFIYNLVGGTGQVYRYDGTGNGSFLVTIAGQAGTGPYDLLADCAGNFYVLSATGYTKFMRKYSPAGALLQSWTLSVPSNYWPGAGFGIMGANIYTDQQNSTPQLASGTIGTTQVTIGNYTPSLPAYSGGFFYDQIGDLGSCASAVPTLPTITITASQTNVCAGSSVTFSSTINSGGSAPQYQWFVNGSPVSGATGASYSYIPQNGDVVTCQLTSNAVCVTTPVAMSNPISITVNPGGNPTVAYVGSPFCASGTVSPTFSPGGGSFSATPGGLSINASNGTINLSASSAGTYTVSYTIPASGGCPAQTATASVVVNTSPNAGISYAGSPYCAGSGTASVTQTGSTGGTYTASPSGLSINATTGAVDLAASTPGTYTVTYSIAANGGCAAFTTTGAIVINPAPTATISYPGSPYCTGGGTATVTQTGTTGGTYTAAPSGLSINAGTGAVNLASSTAGTYTVAYTVAASGGCPAFTTTATIVISTAPTATISYAGSPYCAGSGTASVSQTGSTGGTYTATPSGLSINATTGAVNLASSTAGTYTVTYNIPAANGCAAYSTTAQLVVAPTYSQTLNASICQGNTYAFGGNSYTSSGTYPALFQSVYGCDSAVTLNLTVNPPASSSLNASICQGGSYAFGGNAYTAAGSYPVTFATSAGCDSIATLNLTILPTTSSTLNVSINQGSSYVFNGQNLNTTGQYTATVAGSNGCDSVITLNLTVLPLVITNLNAILCYGDTYNFNGTLLNAPGLYTDSLVAWNGADSVVNLSLTVMPQLSSTQSATICNGASYSFNGQSLSTSGTYIDTLAGTMGCDSVITLNLTVQPAVPLPVVSNISVCQGSPSFTLSASGQNLTWYDAPSGGNVLPAPIVINTATPGTTAYFVSQTINGCEGARASVLVEILLQPTALLTGAASQCISDTFWVAYSGNGTAGMNYTWNLPNTGVAWAQGSGMGPAGVLFNTPGTYTVGLTVSNGQCASQTVSMDVTVVGPAQATFVMPDHGCVGEQQIVALNYTSSPNATYTWDLDGGHSLFGEQGMPKAVIYDQPGVYYVSLTTNMNGCGSTPYVDSIHIHALPVAQIASQPGLLCEQDTFRFSAVPQPGLNQYVWGPLRWNPQPADPYSSVLHVLNSGFVTLEVISEYGCSAIDSIAVTAQLCCTVSMPSAFTPNGDGRNDVFRPMTVGHQNISRFRIVNRWGQEVFSTADQSQGWDGTLNGVPQELGTYYYVLDYYCSNGKHYVMKGDVTLVR